MTRVRPFAHARGAPQAVPDHIIPTRHCAPCLRRTFRLRHIPRRAVHIAPSHARGYDELDTETQIWMFYVFQSRQLRSDPLDWPLFGGMWEQKWYFDILISFGIRKGFMFYQRTTDGVSYIIGREELDTLNCIDDFAGVAPCISSACPSFEGLRTLLCELGLDEKIRRHHLPPRS